MRVIRHIPVLLLIQLLYNSVKAQNFAFNNSGALPDTSAIVDVTSTTKGFLLPRMTSSQAALIPKPAKGLLLYNQDIDALQLNIGTSASPSWQTVSFLKNSWLVTGNSGIPSASRFIGTTDSVSLRFRTNNIARMVIDSLGSVGIGTATPNAAAKLDISGNVKLGTTGTVIKNIIAFSSTISSTAINAPNTSALNVAGVSVLGSYSASVTDVTVNIPSGSQPGTTSAVVNVSPGFDLPTGVSIASARLISSTQLKIRFLNAGSAAQSLTGILYITITEF
ncbi:hypothetical protein [Ferruginibacter albus]|uniref:hypothetical protein n=1 Tax=Ferruginibacter albus TaxID=2875540 RepID=UPI001CC46D12|nr:hypothetical protein [Ferruginibacter albus]UAY52559.1 hypothetical protein K9M53_02435 [Ferruginibacter albus]